MSEPRKRRRRGQSSRDAMLESNHLPTFQSAPVLIEYNVSRGHFLLLFCNSIVTNSFPEKG